MTGENRFRRAMAARDAVRRERLSAHTWTADVWHGRRVMVCASCGYVWKPEMIKPTQDCRSPGGTARKEVTGPLKDDGSGRPASHPARVAENAQEAVQGDDADLDQQHDPLRGVHVQGSTLKAR